MAHLTLLSMVNWRRVLDGSAPSHPTFLTWRDILAASHLHHYGCWVVQMSSPNVTLDLTAALAAVTSNSIRFTRYWCFIMFILGLVGHTLNICVFTRPTLRSSPCARYFMASAVAGHAVIFIILPVRLLQFGYGLSLFLPLVPMCKFLTFLFSWIRYARSSHEEQSVVFKSLYFHIGFYPAGL